MVKPRAGDRLPCKGFTFPLDVARRTAKYTLAFDAVVEPEGAPGKKQPGWIFSVDGAKEGVLVTAPS
jgi:hypothetical protein